MTGEVYSDSEAQKQEAIASEVLRERQALQEAEGGGPAGVTGMLIDEATDAVVRISVAGTIKMANKNVLKSFGYKKVL